MLHDDPRRSLYRGPIRSHLIDPQELKLPKHPQYTYGDRIVALTRGESGIVTGQTPTLKTSAFRNLPATCTDVNNEAERMGMHLAGAVVRARSAILIFAVLSSSVAVAKDHQWKDAKVIDITSERGGAAVVPLVALTGGPITKTFYWIQTDDTIYVLGPVLTRSQLLNVTLHGPTKLAVDGNNAHILDDYGKDEKLRVVKKVARPKPEDPR
jgi:hypothetical protein